MRRVFFDTNIFSHLDADERLRMALVRAIREHHVEVLVTPTVQEELERGPLRGVPAWLPVRYEGEGIAMVGGQVGDHLSDGDLMRAHLGSSTKVNDAILAESAQLADVCVSEDRRFRSRLSAVGSTAEVLDLAQFKLWLARILEEAAAQQLRGR